MDQQRRPKPPHPISTLMFGSRWLQLPLYLGLINAQAVYVCQFMREALAIAGVERILPPVARDGKPSH